MPRIAHIAILSDDNEGLAAFYVHSFGMKVVDRQPYTDRPDLAALYLSDGNINLAILPTAISGGLSAGLHHFGIAVDDVEAAKELAVKHGGTAGDALPRDGRYAESYVIDPSGIRVDVSAAGWRTKPVDDSA